MPTAAARRAAAAVAAAVLASRLAGAGAAPGRGGLVEVAPGREFSWADAIRGVRKGRGISEEVFRAKGAGAGRAFDIKDFESPGPFNVSSLVVEVPRSCYWPDNNRETFPARIFYPDPIGQAPGKWPVVIFLPPTQYSDYGLFTRNLEHIASHGFIVAVTAEAGRPMCMAFFAYMVRPTFTEDPTCRLHWRLGCRGRDMLGAVDAANADRLSVLHDRVDLESVGVVGYSFGGAAGLRMIVDGDEDLQRRVKAFVPISSDQFTAGQPFFQFAEFTKTMQHCPVMAVIGEGDGVYPPDGPWLAYRGTEVPAVFPLHRDAYHLPWGPSWPGMTDHQPAVTAFLSLYLHQDSRSQPVIWGEGRGSLERYEKLSSYITRPRVTLEVEGDETILMAPGEDLTVRLRLSNEGGRATGSRGGPATPWHLTYRTSSFLSDAKYNVRDQVAFELSKRTTGAIEKGAWEEFELRIQADPAIEVSEQSAREVKVEVVATSDWDKGTAAYAQLNIMLAPPGFRGPNRGR